AFLALRLHQLSDLFGVESQQYVVLLYLSPMFDGPFNDEWACPGPEAHADFGSRVPFDGPLQRRAGNERPFGGFHRRARNECAAAGLGPLGIWFLLGGDCPVAGQAREHQARESERRRPSRSCRHEASPSWIGGTDG